MADYARSVWVLCDRCGGSEWVNGHVDPEAACHRCDCFGGLTDASDDGELAEVIDFPGAPQVKVSSGPVVIGYSAQGRPVIRDHAGRVSEVFDINDPEAWF
ncbi:hypothetical protein [Nocardia sp. NPDC005366]|uniref:hypothetical protein n=1 Tax=Nocardia sp. NPDC005366 TaxID=3156878 RepID=UPI0033BAF39D